MRRAIAILAVVLMLVAGGAGSAFARTPALDAGLGYLASAQQADGSWGGDALPSDAMPATAHAMLALSAGGEASSANYASASLWLASQSLDTTEYMSLRMLALSDATLDQQLLISYLDSLYYVWGGYEDYDPDIKDTALAMLALDWAGYSDATLLSYNLGYLLAAQNEDGGWGLYKGDEDSSTQMTALVLRALKPYAYSYASVATAVNKAVTYLLAHRNTDGGFGPSAGSGLAPSTVYDTAMAYMALSGVSADSAVLGGAAGYLEGTQQSDGSWAGDPYQTALALEALALAEGGSTTEPSAATVSGAVIDASSHAPLGGVLVALASQSLSTTTAGDGGFRLDGIEAGTLTLEFSATGYSSATVELSVAAGEMKDVGTVMLSVNPTTGILAGTVTDSATGAALAGAAVSVTGAYTASTTTGADGTYRITDVTPGTVTIMATADGYYSANGTGTVSAGGTLGYSPKLTAIEVQETTGSITGTVVDGTSGAALAGVVIVLGSDSSISAMTDSGGAFTLSSVPTGAQTIYCSLLGYVTAEVQMNVEGGAVADAGAIALSMRPTAGVVRGTVTDAVTGDALSGATVALSGAASATTTSAADGSFRFDNVTVGSVRVTASVQGYSTASVSGSVTAGGTLMISIALSPTTGTLSGAVVDAKTGLPIARATVSIYGGSAATDAAGAFSVEGLEEGTYTVTVSADGYEAQTYHVIVSAGYVNDMGTVKLAEMASSTTASGTVTDASTGEPISGATVTVVEAGLTATTGADGSYSIDGIGQLEFTLRASATGYNSSSYAMSTSGYGEFAVDFALDVYEVSAIEIEAVSFDKESYAADEDVVITGTLVNHGADDVDVFLLAEVIDDAGEVVSVAYADGQSTIAAGGEATVELTWNTGQFSPIGYTVVFKAMEAAGEGTYGEDVYNTTLEVLAEKSVSLTITEVSLVEAYVSVDPPATTADFQTPVKITAAARNAGNVAANTTARAEVGHGGLVDYSAEVPIEGLEVNGVVELDFGSFTPTEGGEYNVTLTSTEPSVEMSATATLYVGVHASATFTVSPENAVAGDTSVTGTITVTGEGVGDVTVEDPLVQLVKQALQDSVGWTQSNALNWQRQKGCFGCHVQTQALIGLELSRDKVTVDDGAVSTLINYMKSVQKSSGYIAHFTWNDSEPTPLETTTLFAWAASYYHDSDVVSSSLVKALGYFLPYQHSSGYWVSDYYYGDGDWWSDLGRGYPSTPFTAYNIISMSKGYQLTENESYKSAIVKAANYLVYMNYAQSIITAAHVVIGLEAALPYIEDASLLGAAESRIEEAVAYLRSTQNADGGWARYYGNASDPLPTAHALYAIGRTISNGTDDTTLRSGATYLLNMQNSDGSWSSSFVRGNTYPDTRFAATTWATISLPVTLSAISGISGTLSVTLPSDITLESASPSVSAKVVSGDATTYSWDLTGLNSVGTDIYLNITVHSLEASETRSIADSAYLSFENEYNGEQTTISVDIPYVVVVAPAIVEVETDKATYQAEEDVFISVTLTTDRNIQSLNGDMEVYIEDAEGETVTLVGENSISHENSLYSSWTYIVTFAVAINEDKNDASVAHEIDLDDVLLSLGGDGTVNPDSIRVVEETTDGVKEMQRRYITEANTLIWLMEGFTYAETPRTFRIYFDTFESGPKDSPDAGDLNVKGLSASYYSLNTALTNVWSSNPDDIIFGSFLLSRVDTSFISSWSGESPDTSIPTDYFGAEWDGLIYIGQSGTYTMETSSDDGSWLWLDGVLIVNNYGMHPMNSKSGSVYLDAGFHKIKIKFFENFGGSGMVLYWTDQYGSREAMPSDILYPVISSTVTELYRGLNGASSGTYSFVWNIGSTYAGEYQVQAVLLQDGTVISEGNTLFTILPDGNLAAGVTTDKASYESGETAAITARITSTSTNSVYEDISGSVAITSPEGAVVFDESLSVSVLASGQVVDKKLYWDSGSAAKGAYTVKFTASNATGTTASDSVTFDVEGTAETGEGLTGTLSVGPDPLSYGDVATLSYTVNNGGNEDLAQLAVTLLVVDPETNSALTAESYTLDLGVGETKGGGFQVSTTSLTVNKTYLAVLTARTTAMAGDKTLSSATFKAEDLTPPQVTALKPESGGIYNGPVLLKASAKDDASGVASVEYRIDSGSWSAMSSDGGDAYTSTWTPSSTDEGSHAVYFRATDKAGNVSNSVSVSITIDLTPPAPLMITSPEEGYISVVDTLTIEGLSEAGAWIEMTLSGVATFFINDGSEEFQFVDLILEIGENVFTFVAEDLAGNRSEPRVLTVVYAPIEMTISLPSDERNALVRINTGCDPETLKNCDNLETVLSVVDELMPGATVVYDKKDFQSELGNPYYTDIVILGDQSPIEDHYSDILREKVSAGMGLVSSTFTREGLDDSVFGIKQTGSLAGSGFTLEVEDSDMSPAATYQTIGDALSVESEGAEVLGWAVEETNKGVEYHPAVLSNIYGDGRTVLFAVELEAQGAEVMKALLGAAAEYAHHAPEAGAEYAPYSLVPLRVALSTEGEAIDVRYELAYPEGISIYNASSGEWLSESPYVLEAAVEKDSPVEAVLYLLTPEAEGTYVLESAVGYLKGEEFVEVASEEQELIVVSREALVDTAISEMRTLVVSTEEAEWVAEAVSSVEGMGLRGYSTEEAVESDIKDLLHAIDMIRKVTSADASGAIWAMDALLESLVEGLYMIY